MTRGSTNAVIHDPPGSEESSNSARTNETTAEPRRMRTSWSLNCARMRVKSDVGEASGRADEASVSLSPLDSTNAMMG